jgi:hypothetical protein
MIKEDHPNDMAKQKEIYDRVEEANRFHNSGNIFTAHAIEKFNAFV